MTVILDIRRHAERAGSGGVGSALSVDGVEMARRLRRDDDGYALVVSSPRERAQETAALIGGRVDEVESHLGGSADEALTQRQYDSLTSQVAIAEHLGMNAAARAFAEEQLSVWERLARRLRDGERALVVTHGGNIELPAVLLAVRIGREVGPLPLNYCEGVRVEYSEGKPAGLRRLDALLD